MHDGQLHLSLGDVVRWPGEEYTVTKVLGGKGDKVVGYVATRPENEIKGELWVVIDSEKGLWEAFSDTLESYSKTTEMVIGDAFEAMKFDNSKEDYKTMALPVDRKGRIVSADQPRDVYGVILWDVLRGPFEDRSDPILWFPNRISLEEFSAVITELNASSLEEEP
jgi:hypothetical protein